ncbi:DUF1501 domain-containing protein [Sphingomonas sp.]|uniref:DUF1501 domain-containing protein n=1 Tax=Sphingomonas sp. TaxID=28214 RepID=UPI0025E5CB82|nr:DUF1501 domain-containing protein [Sphingomonas sp.]
MSTDQSRRAFLQRSAAFGLAGAASPFVLNLAAAGEAAAAVSSDYKALVCVFLNGGNDYANTVTPYDQASYDLYQKLRPELAYRRDSLTGTLLRPSVALPGGRQYALGPAMLPLLPAFDAGKLAVVLNVGTLAQPTTKTQYRSNGAVLPPKLFSHNDQQSYWQASSPEGAQSGWGGRMGDLFQSGNGSATLTCINPTNNAVFLTGKAAVQYSMGTGGPIQLTANSSLFGSASASAALKSIMSATHTNMLENEHGRIGKRSLDTYAQVAGALNAATPLATAFPSSNALADQLKLVARMISVSSQLGAKRQVFFVSMGGFDLHDNLAANQPILLAKLSSAMKAFYDATVELGVSDKVTSFTASDFGRTLVPNNDGSDHGWGSMHFVLGGAVRGQRFYGTPPVVADNGPDDLGQGRLVPTIAVDQYASTLATWFGVSDSDMSTVLPNINNYSPSSRNLGFV